VNSPANSILLLGESGVGKTHFGAQLLKRLMKGGGRLGMDGQATNLEPFEAALESLNEGKSAGHTATSTYIDSVWPVVNALGRRAELIWPDYGGEQIKSMIDSRRVPNDWRTRVRRAPAWLLLIRLQQTRVRDDLFSKPLADLRSTSLDNRDVQMSDQARLIELLQMLNYVGDVTAEHQRSHSRLGVLLTCWDELAFDGTPAEALEERLPLLRAFIRSNWSTPSVMGLSALGRSLSKSERDIDYVSQGPENFGYIVMPDGLHSPDLTLPIQLLLGDVQ